MKRLVLALVSAVLIAGCGGGDAPSSEAEPPATSVYKEWPFDDAEATRRQAEAAKALGVEVEQEFDLAPGVKITMVLIPAGTFAIGSPSDEESRHDDEAQKAVTISHPFWMSKHEVTQAPWEAVTGRNPSQFKGAKNPVENVSWDDIEEFLKKVNAHPLGGRFALPTEAQWEYACRAGTQTPFHFGDTISTDQANYNGTYTYGAGRKGVGRGKTMSVGSFPSNAWGLRDVHGNVWEWCASPYAKSYDGTEQKGAHAEGRFRVLRGGGWLGSPLGCRSALRGRYSPLFSVSTLGFRLVRSARTLP